MDKKDEKNKKNEQTEEQEEQTQKDDQERTDEKLEEKVLELENNYKRALADYQNLQKRVREERQEWIRSANKDLLLRLLPILDTLNLAQKHIQNDGLKVTIQQFLDTLKTEGITKIEAKGKDFDPNLMECIQTGEGEENKVLEELREGYMLYDKVLRAAQVKVGKAEKS